MYVSGVLDRQLLNGCCHRHQNRRLCSSPHSHESVIFFVFLGFILFTQRPLFICRVHNHLTSAGGDHERRVRSLAIGREKRGTTQVMLGVSLQAWWDTTLVLLIHR